jgi:uncharacterized protein (DUF433 family)
VAQAIIRDPEIMHGVPVFRGTRVPVQTLFDYLEGGETLEDFLEGFPTVPRSLALEALEEARILLLMNCRVSESLSFAQSGAANEPRRGWCVLRSSWHRDSASHAFHVWGGAAMGIG